MSNETQTVDSISAANLVEAAAQILGIEAVPDDGLVAVDPSVEAVEVSVTQAEPTPEELKAKAEAEREAVLAAMTPIQRMIEEAFQEYKKNSLDQQIEHQDIRLYSTHAEVGVNGIKKAISLTDFKEILDSMLAVNEPNLPAFKLPEGTFHFAVNGSTMQIACYYPSAERQIKYLKDEPTHTLTFPNVIISHELRKKDKGWTVEATHYLCTDKTVGALPDKFFTRPKSSENIYLIPIPNMYDSGDMCFGSNTMPRVFTQNLRGLDYYFQVIFLAPFNNDLGIRATGQSDVKGWLDSWQESKGVFPYNKIRER